MNLEETLASLVKAEVAPLRVGFERLAASVDELRRTLPPQLESVEAAAGRLGVSLSTARRRVKDGSWPVRRDGRRVLVDLAALRAATSEEIVEKVREARAAGED